MEMHRCSSVIMNEQGLKVVSDILKERCVILAHFPRRLWEEAVGKSEMIRKYFPNPFPENPID